MNGIPGELLRSLCKTLGDCDEFKSDKKLKAVFIDDRLAFLQRELNDSDSVRDRVDNTILLLKEKWRADTHANCLVLLLDILRDRADTNDALYLQLRDLAEKLQDNTLRRSSMLEEANPGNQPTIFVAELLKLSESTLAVGQVKVPQIVCGEATQRIPCGTGWLIAPGLAMTCWHVMKARSYLDGRLRDTDRDMQVVNSVLAFDYTLPGTGVEYRVAGLECYDSVLDYALLRLEDRVDHPLSAYGFLKLDVDAPMTLLTSLYIIQHPKGQPQQISSGLFKRYVEDQPKRFFHSAPTEDGTSGAPVLNVTNGRVVALHNGENKDEDLREATLLRAILAHAKLTRLDLYHEIVKVDQER